MNNAQFWEIISQTFSEEQEEQEAKLRNILSDLSVEELIDFDLTYRRHKKRAHHWDVWAAAYIINGGCSDDGFDYFKDWLISRGEGVFENALTEPETMIGIATPWETEFEGFSYVAMEVMEAKGGQFPKVPPELLHSDPEGDNWDEETVEMKYPKLSEWVNTSQTSQNPTAPLETQSEFNILPILITVGLTVVFAYNALRLWLN